MFSNPEIQESGSPSRRHDPRSTERGGSASRDRLQALRNIPPVLRFVWESGPAVVFWNIALRIFVAFLPVGIGIIGRFIIDGVNRIRLHQPLPLGILVAGGGRTGAGSAERCNFAGS